MSEYIIYENELLTEARITKDSVESRIRIVVDKETSYGSTIPYFKAYDLRHKDTRRVIRLHFKDNSYEVHNKDSDESIWKFNNRQAKEIREIMLKKNYKHEKYSNWEVSCFTWNRINSMFGNISGALDEKDLLDNFMNGKYDKIENEKVGYLQSTQRIPELWKWVGENPKLKELYLVPELECDR